MTNTYKVPPELTLGHNIAFRVPKSDQIRQRLEVEEILRRLQSQPGVILADEVGMGKTFVALAAAYSVAVGSRRGPVVVMVPANLVDKWEQDLKTFCELYLDHRQPVRRDDVTQGSLAYPSYVRYGVARHSVDLMKLLDDSPRIRCHLIFLAQGAMGRQQSDKWVRLALIAETLRRHGRGKASRLIKVKRQIHRFLAELLWAIGEERAHDLGEELWQRLLATDPRVWKEIYNRSLHNEQRQLVDDPVPKYVVRALDRIDLKSLASSLEQMPVRARGGDDRVSARLNIARRALRKVEEALWKDLLAQARWRSPLLVMDEAHHLKNPSTSLARQLQSADSEQDLRTGDGAMANAFDRMLFLTATPFQLGHHELVRVLERFGDVRWDENELVTRAEFRQGLVDLSNYLNDSQRTAIALQRCWSRLEQEDCETDNVGAWWDELMGRPRELLNHRQRAVVDAYGAARRTRDAAEQALRTWIVRHNKGNYWGETDIPRRKRRDGAEVIGGETTGGIAVPPDQLLPFFLAARSAVSREHDLLGEALCSSYEAFRFTRSNRDPEKDDEDESLLAVPDLAHSRWYLREFDQSLDRFSGSMHPKISSTVRTVVDLWEAGEKVLVFAFYRRTCGALRFYISREIERRIKTTGRTRLMEAGRAHSPRDVDQVLERVQKRYFDDTDSPGRRAVDVALGEIIRSHADLLDAAQVSGEDRTALVDVMRRFLRVPTTLVRCFPIASLHSIKPAEAVVATLNHTDVTGITWSGKFGGFIGYLTRSCSIEERRLYLEAAKRTQTGGIRVEGQDDEDDDSASGHITLANVQVATGKTRRSARARLMRAFNTPFFPDILVCSQVMGEGVDLQRFCRHVVHHDLAWNPSTIEQRTGRVDRLGCKAEGRQPIIVDLPYLAGTADERQYKVMSERERWFRVVMGQDAVAQLITPSSEDVLPLPDSISSGLGFQLGLEDYVS
jgi:superfamily II DNA or RNA helicase